MVAIDRSISSPMLNIGDEIEAMIGQVQATSSVPVSDHESVTAVTTILSNIAYLLVYLEGNIRYLGCETPLQRCSDYLKLHISTKTDLEIEAKLDELNVAARRLFQQIEVSQSRLLGRLGIATGTASVSALYRRVLTRTSRPATRSKLLQVWNGEREKLTGSVSTILDKTIQLRREHARANGYDTVLQQTFHKCTISEADAETFINTYLVLALQSHAHLESMVSDAIGPIDRPMDHFGYYLHTLLKGIEIPRFSLDACLDLISDVSNDIFGVALVGEPDDDPCTKSVVVLRDTEIGRIRFDLVNVGVNHEIEPPTSEEHPSRGRVENARSPIGRVLCRFHEQAIGRRVVSFDSAFSIFHECGHAINHLLLRQRSPSVSGLDYLPPERLENLSMWFEKWVFHPVFAEHLDLSNEDRDGLALCQRIKKLEFMAHNLETAVTAALDFVVHGKKDGGFGDAFRQLDDEFQVSDHVSFGGLLEHFTAPMFRAHPGAGFLYLWGAADSSQRFAPLLHTSMKDNARQVDHNAMLRSWFDPTEKSTEPDVQAVFRFFDAETVG